MKLRPYQENLVNGCRTALATARRIIAYLPTGAGKTLVSTSIIEMAMAKGKRVAFICNRLQLIEQTSAVFDSLGIEHGVLQGSNTRNTGAQVLVCSIQTIAKIPMPDVDLIIIDECHGVAGTKAYQDVMRGKMVIGLTATTYQAGLGRHHPELGGALFETVVVGADMREMIDAGYLVDADVWAPADPDLSTVKVVAGDYQESQLGEVMNDSGLVGDIVSHWFKIANNTRTMVFAVNIAHSRHICQQFQEAGVAAVHVDYHMTPDEKRDIYQGFRNGEHLVLCNCALLSEGADFPACETLILARPTKSRVRYVQMFGRVLRPFPGKLRATVLDHSGSTVKLGLPWDFSVTHLDTGKPKKSGEACAEEKPAPLPKACPSCSFLKPPSTPLCPRCGFAATRPSDIEMGEGELVPLTKITKPKGLKALEDIGRTNVYHQLLWIARDRGYSEGWASQKYKTAFGNWPGSISKDLEKPCGVVLSWEHSQRIAWAKSQKRAS